MRGSLAAYLGTKKPGSGSLAHFSRPIPAKTMEPSDEFLLFEEASDANDANDAHPHPQQQHAQPQQLQPFQPFQPFVSPQQIPAGSPVGMLVSHLTNSLSSINSEANYTMRSIVAMTEVRARPPSCDRA